MEPRLLIKHAAKMKKNVNLKYKMSAMTANELHPRNLMIKIIPLLLMLFSWVYPLSAQDQIDIGIFSSANPNQIDVNIRPNFTINSNQVISNIKYSIRWSDPSIVITNITYISPYFLAPQGGPVLSGGYYYQLFDCVPGAPVGSTISPGQEVLVSSFTYSAGSSCSFFEIIDSDAWTSANNADFYVELGGANVTGIVYDEFAPDFPVSCPDPMTVCCNDAPFILSVGSPEGGTYSGTHVTFDGTDYIFTPTCTSTGIFDITYTRADGCNSCIFMVTVLDVPDAPVSGGDQTICSGEIIPALSVTVGTDETADWYDAATGGNLLLSGSLSYTPTAAGTYYAEAMNNTTSCVSTTRTGVTLTVYNQLVAGAITSGDDQEICYGQTPASITAGAPSGGSGTFTYLWQVYNSGTDAWDDISGETSLTYQPDALTVTTTYCLAQTDEYCTPDQVVYTDAVTITVWELPEVTAVSLQSSTDLTNWTAVEGDLEGGYEMCLNPVIDYHYLDIDELTSTVELMSTAFEQNAFFLDTVNLPEGFYEYWATKGVVEGATGWQGIMWDIINGDAPMFYISYDGIDDYALIDGLLYQAGGGAQTLRINGDYPPGNYTFTGSVTDINECESLPFDVNILFTPFPVIICPGDISVNNDPGECGAEVNFAIIVDGVVINLSQYFPVGTTIVTATTENECGAVSCEFNVTVTDIEPPTFTAPADITIYRDANCSYDASITVTGDVTNEDDNCYPGEATYNDVIDDSNPCELVITRTWSLVDINGNEAADQIQIITVIDNTPPTITPGTIASCYASVGEAEAAAIAATDYYDNCAGQSELVVAAETTGDYYVTITISVTDPCDNSSSVDYNTIVNPTPLIADFEADNLFPPKHTTVQFTSLSTGDPATYLWSFSPNTVIFVDNTDADSPDPKVQFTNGGLYNVTLTVTNDCYDDTETKVGYIRAGIHGLWIGTSSKEWNTSSNWDDALIPDKLTDVRITTSTGPDFWPKFTGDLLVGDDPSAHCKSLTFEGDGYLLTVKGMLTTVANGMENSMQVLTGANGRIKFENP